MAVEETSSNVPKAIAAILTLLAALVPVWRKVNKETLRSDASKISALESRVHELESYKADNEKRWNAVRTTLDVMQEEREVTERKIGRMAVAHDELRDVVQEHLKNLRNYVDDVLRVVSTGRIGQQLNEPRGPNHPV